MDITTKVTVKSLLQSSGGRSTSSVRLVENDVAFTYRGMWLSVEQPSEAASQRDETVPPHGSLAVDEPLRAWHSNEETVE